MGIFTSIMRIIHGKLYTALSLQKHLQFIGFGFKRLLTKENEDMEVMFCFYQTFKSRFFCAVQTLVFKFCTRKSAKILLKIA